MLVSTISLARHKLCRFEMTNMHPSMMNCLAVVFAAVCILKGPIISGGIFSFSHRIVVVEAFSPTLPTNFRSANRGTLALYSSKNDKEEEESFSIVGKEPSGSAENESFVNVNVAPLAIQKNEPLSKAEPDIITKASWYAVELLGKAFGGGSKGRREPEEARRKTASSVDLTQPPKSLDETLIRLEMDSERSYFVSGQVDELIYDEDCVFADPFVSFAGRQRFVDNLQNLGSFITKYNVKVLTNPTVISQETATNSNVISVDTKYMVKLELNLPWKPILAWPWGVRYDVDPSSFLVTTHRESWDVSPVEGVKQIFRKPTLKI